MCKIYIEKSLVPKAAQKKAVFGWGCGSEWVVRQRWRAISSHKYGIVNKPLDNAGGNISPFSPAEPQASQSSPVALQHQRKPHHPQNPFCNLVLLLRNTKQPTRTGSGEEQTPPQAPEGTQGRSLVPGSPRPTPRSPWKPWEHRQRPH